MSPATKRLQLAATLSTLVLGSTATGAMAAGISPATFSVALARAGSIASGAALTGTGVVTSCADDNSGGTLRSVIGSAVNGDTILLTGLPAANANCVSGVITLSLGVIPVNKDLTLVGPGPDVLAIAAPASGSRVFFSNSASQLEIDDLTVRGGRATDGGGCIYATGSVTLQHSTVSDCHVNGGTAVAAGGGIFANTVTLRNGSLVTGNSAILVGNNKYAGAGGGAVAVTVLTCSDSTISNNYANNSGGGFLAVGHATITRCTIEGNSARLAGGGIADTPNSAQSSVIQSTISGNSAPKGGGINMQAEFYIASSTIAYNSAANGYAGGIVSTAPYLALQSSIIARNISIGSTHADLQATTFVGGGQNLIQSALAPNYDFITVTGDPMLMPMADNGGPTRTHALSAASPAIDAGNNITGASTDQRGAGFLREVPTGKPDIGAFEFRGDGIFIDGFE